MKLSEANSSKTVEASQRHCPDHLLNNYVLHKDKSPQEYIYNFHPLDVISHLQDSLTVLSYVLCQRRLTYSLLEGVKDSTDG